MMQNKITEGKKSDFFIYSNLFIQIYSNLFIHYGSLPLYPL